MDLEILDVETPSKTVKVRQAFTICFKVVGGVSGFQFPFSNESTTEKLLEFIKEVS